MLNQSTSGVGGPNELRRVVAGPSSTFPAMMALAVSLLMASAAYADDYGVLVAVSKHAFAKYDLPMAAVNREVMEKALGEVGIQHLQVLEDERVNRSSIRTLLEMMLPRRLKSGDRLFLYYTGHGMAVDVSGAIVRAYFTFETTKDKNDKYRTDTLISDLDLQEWLEPLRQAGVEVFFLRECCFNGRGYSEALSEAAPSEPEDISVLSVADIELSAASLDQAAHAVELPDGRFVGIFTKVVSEQLMDTERSSLTAEELASAVEREVPSRQVGQTPQRGGDAAKFAGFMVFDRRVISLTLQTFDGLSKEVVEGASVRFRGKEQGATPLTIQSLPREPGRIYPEISKEGYVPESLVIELDPKAAHQDERIALMPAFATVVGGVVEASGKDLSGVKISFEMAGSQPRPKRLIDTEVETNDEGAFRLRLPPGRAYNLVLFGGSGSVLARLPIADGKPLEAVHVHGRPYDMGTLKISLRREGPTYNERRFQELFDQSKKSLEQKDYLAAHKAIDKAQIYAEGVDNEESSRSLQERVALLRERILTDERRAQCAELLSRAQQAVDAEEYDRAATLVDQILRVDPSNFDAKAMRVEIEYSRPVKTGAEGLPPDAGPPGGTRRPSSLSPEAGDVRWHDFPDGSREVEMVYVPAGTFVLGDRTEGGDADEQPAHEVHISKGFYIDRYEVTWRQYRTFCDATNRPYPDEHRAGVGEDLPVVNVTWFDAVDYAQWAGKRLPTEAEWEYAAKGPQGAAILFPWGNEREPARADTPDSGRRESDWRTYLRAPGSSGIEGASWCGAQDLAGNVWEWCQDYYAKDAYARLDDGASDPNGPRSGTYRVVRGGGWMSLLDSCRVTNRSGGRPGSKRAAVGFRCVWEPK